MPCYGGFMKERVLLPFEGTKEQEAELRKQLALVKKEADGSTIMALQKAQAIYGYLPREVQSIVAEELGISLAQVYGVATFYSQFSLYPKGKYQIGVCLGTACYVKGSGDVYNKLQEILGISGGEVTADRMFSLDATRCVGCCGLAPVMTVNGEVYGFVTVDSVAEIIEKYRKEG